MSDEEQSMSYVDLPPLKKGDRVYNKDGRRFYEIISNTVNEGGFGRIYKVYGSRKNKDGSRHVDALKEFCLNDDSNRSRSSMGDYTRIYNSAKIDLMVKKFKMEVELLKELNKQKDRHVPVVHYKEFWDEDRLFYVMTYIDGPTLTDVVEENGVMTEEAAVGYIVQIGKVLYKAHKWGLMHCDISPNNIMLDGDFAVLVDFGNAKSYDQLLVSLDEAPQNVIEEMELAGTPGFSPSPIYIGSPQGDVYSLAATLFYLLTGSKVGTLETERACDKLIAKLINRKISIETIYAIMNALKLDSSNSTKDAKTFLSQLPYNIVFNSLLNYNDHDYNKR